MARLRLRWQTGLALVFAGSVLVLLWSRTTFGGAGDVVIASPTSFSSLDGSAQDSDGKEDGTFTVAGSLTIGSRGSISVNGRRGGNSEDVTLIVGGDFVMDSSAVISSGRVSDHGMVEAGDITITASDDVTISAGAEVRANAPSKGGSIEIRGRVIDVDGLVSSTATTPAGRGGPISIIASRDLTVSDLGAIRADANLVHLEGCAVAIYGLVQSPGSGHANLSGDNLCNDPPRPGHAPDSTACVEVWAATSIVVDGTSPHNGEIDVDTALSGLAQDPGWVELFSGGEILVFGDTSGAFAVHANQPNVTDGRGGEIRASTVGTETAENDIRATGFAFQADAVSAGGSGGRLVLEAAGGIDLSTASISARGDFDPIGGFGHGGTVRLFAAGGSVEVGTGDVRPTGTDVAPDRRGCVVVRSSETLFLSIVLHFQYLGAPTCFDAWGRIPIPVPSLPGYVSLLPSICRGTPTPNLTPATPTETPPDFPYTPTNTATPNRIFIESAQATPTPTRTPQTPFEEPGRQLLSP